MTWLDRWIWFIRLESELRTDSGCVCALYKELERELELQVGLKQEMEVAMRLLEKDTHEKQDTLAALRLQLDQVKTLNLQMFHKAQVSQHAQRCLSCLEIQTHPHTEHPHVMCFSTGLAARGGEETAGG